MNIDDTFPDFDLPRDGGGMLGSKDLQGKAWVLFLYPKDDTPGCTAESIEFTEKLDQFTQAGVSVIGLSKDPVRKHDKFVEKHNLGVPLLSDETGELVEKLGCWVEKNLYGRKYMGIERTTFLIGPSGKIHNVWRKVKVKGHVDIVLEAAKSM